jgi:hypothetical protein
VKAARSIKATTHMARLLTWNGCVPHTDPPPIKSKISINLLNNIALTNYSLNDLSRNKHS